MHLSRIDRARRAYLLVICQREPNWIMRDYLEEKVDRIFQLDRAEDIAEMLDGESRRLFDNIMDEVAAPQRP